MFLKFVPAGEAQPEVVELTESNLAKVGNLLLKGVVKISSNELTPSCCSVFHT